MPSRKQRRRRAKERRHEYEYVYVDEEGREVDAEEAEEPPARPARGGKGERPGRPVTRGGRTIEPPSWRRVGKRALIFAPLMFLTISLIDKAQSPGVRIVNTVLLLALFLPFSYFMDAMLYRQAARRSGAAGKREPRGR